METLAHSGRRLVVGHERTVTYRHVPPAPLTPLIGRADELAELTGVLAGERLVTLTGAGGCGKTRLAYEVAGQVQHSFPGGVAWVELAPCSDREDVVAALVEALDVMEATGEARLDGAIRLLQSRAGSLLVLDNAEHVVATAAEVAAAVLQRVPQVTVVCTSREPIGVPGEVVWRVPSLSEPDAVQLFLDRGSRVRRGFTLTEVNAAAIAHICQRLDGLPLAIELAAARVRSMPPERIAQQLDDRFRLLSGGPRTQLARQQTLHASVAWSEGLLADVERLVFRRLGVFVASFTVEAAEAVVGSFDDLDPYAVAEAVTALVDKSLVQFDDERDRYWMLDTIRSYAMQRLMETEEVARARDALAAWCAGWLEDLAPDERVADVNEWWDSRLAIIGRIDPDWPNCANALDWVTPGSALSLRIVGGLGDYWALRQRATDSARYGMPAVLAGDRATAEWTHAVLRLQTVRTNAGDAQFHELREEALRLAEARGDRRSYVRLELAGRVAMVMLLGPRVELLAAVAEVRSEADELHEWFTAWNARQSPAVMLVSAGRLAEGEALVADLRSARAVLIRAVAEQMRGRLNASLALVAEAHELLDARLGAALDRVLFAFATAGAALALGDRAGLDALRLADVSLETLPPGFTSAYVMATGVQQLVEGRLHEARDTFAAHQPDIFTSWRLLCLLAQTELALGDREAARTAAQQVLDQTGEVPAPLYETVALLVLAECAQPGDVTSALDDAHRALAVAAEAGLWPSVVDALEAIGVLLVEGGRERDGARALAAAASARDAMSYRYRFAHRAAAVTAATTAVGADDGWAEGASLLLPEAVELVQRMRGERVRPVVGWDSLTPTEVQVVEQVAAGLTNPQIAERLLMSRATVKTHLVHVYSKLGIGSRAELAAAAVRRSRR